MIELFRTLTPKIKRMLSRNSFYLRRAVNPWGMVNFDKAAALDVMVISPGGAGTTMLLSELRNVSAVNCISDTDFLKHLPYDRVLCNRLLEKTKVIFLYDDPKRVQLSIERRGWLRIQGSKLGSVLCVLLPEGYQKSIFQKAVERQINGFTSHAHPNLLITNFDTLWGDLDKISLFCDIQNTDFSANFPDRRERKSDNGCTN